MKPLIFLLVILISYNIFATKLEKFKFEGKYEFYEQIEGHCFGFNEDSVDFLSLGYFHFDQVPILVVYNRLNPSTRIALVSDHIGGFQPDDRVFISSKYADAKFEVRGGFLYAEFARSEYKGRKTGKCLFKKV